MATYILQKDLPDVKAGAEGLVNDAGLLCFYEDTSKSSPEYFFPKNSYENHPEWFKLKEEKISIDGLRTTDNPYSYLFRSSRNIHSDKYEAICKAIEFILNGEILVNADKKYEYTEEDMCLCFEAAKKKKCNGLSGDACKMISVYRTFESYIDYLNK